MKYIERPAILQRINLNHHTMIEASAGTGKTYTLEHLVVEILLQKKATIKQILLLTFTEKAVEELRTRVKKLLTAILSTEEEAERPLPENCWAIDKERENILRQALTDFDQATIVTIHSFCQQLLRKYPIYTGQPLTTVLIDDENYLPNICGWVISQIQNNSNNSYYELLKSTLQEQKNGADFVGKLPGIIGSIYTKKGQLENGENPPLSAILIKIIKDCVIQRLEDVKRKQGQLSFDDLLAQVRDSLLSEKYSDAFIKELLAAYPICIIDEFQDTDNVQWSIFKQIYLNSNQGSLFMVGDPKQAIYAFRGAEVRSYLQAKEQLTKLHDRDGAADILNLETNFRSTAPLLGFFNSLFCSTAAPFFTGGITANPLKCGRPENSLKNINHQEIKPVTAIYITPEMCEKASGQPFCGNNKFAGYTAELLDVYQQALARHLKKLLLEKPLITDGKETKPLAADDIFILAAKNDELQSMARHLAKFNIPYNFYKEEGLFQQPEAKEIVDLLLAIANPYDEKLRLRALNTPFFDISLNDVERFTNLPGTHPLMLQLTLWQQLAERHSYTKLFSSILVDSGLSCRQLYLTNNFRSLNSYQRILDVLTNAVADTSYELAEIIDILCQYIENKLPDPQNNRNKHQQQFSEKSVQLLTIHKQKVWKHRWSRWLGDLVAKVN